MNKRTVPVTVCLLCFVLIFLAPMSVHAQTNLPSEPNLTMSPKYSTTEIGDKMRYEIDALSFENNVYGVGGMALEINFSNNPSAMLDNIVIPRFDGISKEPQYGNDITVRVMAFKNNGAVFDTIKEITFESDDGVTSMTVTREEILNYTRDGFPAAISVYFFFGDPAHYSRIDSLYQSAPIICEYTTIDGQVLLRETDQFQRYYAYLHYYDDEIFTNDSYKLISASAFSYFNTSMLTVSADKTDNLRPGDEVELIFTYTNYSSYDNVLLYLGFQGENITLVNPESKDAAKFPSFNWNDSNDYYTAFYDDSAWITLKGGDSFTFSQKIKIDEDFAGSSIDITAFDYHNYDSQRQFGNTITLYIGDVPEENENTPPLTGDKINTTPWIACGIFSLMFVLGVSMQHKKKREYK